MRPPIEIVCAVRHQRLWMWCPGCEDLHAVTLSGWDVDTGPDDDTPTVSPSILVQGGGKNLTCHSFLRGGVWEFLPDSTHALAGQKVPMVPLPEWFVYQDEARP